MKPHLVSIINTIPLTNYFYSLAERIKSYHRQYLNLIHWQIYKTKTLLNLLSVKLCHTNTPANCIAMPNCLFSVLLMWQPIATLSRYDTIYCQSTILLGWTTLIHLRQRHRVCIHEKFISWPRLVKHHIKWMGKAS